MLHTIVLSLLAGLAGLWVATEFVPGVHFAGDLKSFLIAALALGIIIALARPLLNLFSLLIKVAVLVAVILAVVWVLNIFFPELDISSLTSLFWAGLAIAATTVVISLFGRGSV